MSNLPPRLGAVVLDATSTRFTLWAPKHDRVHLVLHDAGTRQPMTPGPDGYHTLTTAAPSGTRYQYELTGGTLRPDPASRAQPDGVHAPSMVVEWPRPTIALVNPPLDRHVIYELHIGTFTPEGTFDAAITKLDHLRDLGVSAIELMPIAQFPGSRNWGYDGVLPFAAQWSYGGIAGLRRLIDACHARGLACFLDVVYNHMGPEGNYLADFGPYFTDRYKTPWGAALNFDGPASDHVREFFIQSALHFTRDCGFDGLRLDAVHAIIDHTAIPFIQDLTQRVHDAARAQGRVVHVIAESCDNDPRLLRDPSVGGFGMDGCWNDDYHHALRAALTGERRGYYAPYGDPSLIARCVRDRFVFTGQYSSGFGRRHGAPASDIPRGRLIAFTQNHDQVGNRPLGDRLDAQAGLDGSRVAAALVLLSPFTPMLWMGEEHAEPAPFQYFVSHTDAGLIEAVRKGRAAEFAAFQLDQPVPDPQAESTFARSKLSWDVLTQPAHAAMLAYYKQLLRLRRTLSIPQHARDIRCESDGSIIAMWRPAPAPMLLLANLSGTPQTKPPFPQTSDAPHPPDPASLALLLNSDDPRWGGSGASPELTSRAWSLPARTATLLSAPEVS